MNLELLTFEIPALSVLATPGVLPADIGSSGRGPIKFIPVDGDSGLLLPGITEFVSGPGFIEPAILKPGVLSGTAPDDESGGPNEFIAPSALTESAFCSCAR